jgi:hypothetical protein
MLTWMAPYRLNVSDKLVAGTNSLKIDVVNVWRNRMVGDLELPASERFTTYLVSDVEKGEKLTPSGLMGPVSIEVIR